MTKQKKQRGVLSQSTNRDTTPPSGRAPSLERPRGDEVDLPSPLALHSFHRFGALEALTTLMHLGVDVSDTILQLLHLFQLVMQLFLQLTILMHFGAESVVSETSQRIVDPVLTPVVVVEDLYPLGRCGCGFLRRNAGRGVGRSSVDRGPWSSHAQGVGVVGHVNGDVLCLYFVAIVQDLEGDVARGYIEPEFFRYVQSWLQVRGASCCRRVRSSSSARRLSSPSASSRGTYLHHCSFGHCFVRSSFVLNRSSFLITSAALEWGLSSVVRSVNSFHVMGAAEEDWEGVALAGVHGVSASQTDDFVSEAGPEGPDELTWLSCPLGTSFGTVAVFSSIGTTAAVRKDHLSPSI
jgi:hypothetical protein